MLNLPDCPRGTGQLSNQHFHPQSIGPLDSKAKSLTNKDAVPRRKTGWHHSYYPSVCVLSNRECSKLFGEDGMTLKLFVKRTAPFSILWTLTNYLYLMALKKLTATDVSALYCCHKAFVFLLSWIVLKDRFMGVRVCMKTPIVIIILSRTVFLTPEEY